MSTTLIEEFVELADAPEISGLSFRKFRGEEDYVHMLAIIDGSKDVDGAERSDTLEDIQRNYKHLTNCDPYQDVLFAEINGQPIAYSQVFWDRLGEGIRVYTAFGFMLPEWRRNGIGTAILRYNEARLLEIAAEHPKDEPRYFQLWATETEKGTHALAKNQGYKPIRYGFEMRRDLSKPFPEAPMLEGLEVRPVKEDQIRSIFEASQEAFRDHWGYREETWEEFQSWVEAPTFNPDIWKIAWDGNQVAGIVMNYIEENENKEYDRKRGYTENISVGRPWRKRGLAKSLIVQSMRMFKEMGMTETALGVDAENTSGALHLYKNCGYKVIKQAATYRKEMKS
jgi:ribosomal protein S18 acetylase RimI-like enzyme